MFVLGHVFEKSWYHIFSLLFKKGYAFLFFFILPSIETIDEKRSVKKLIF